jgi:ubiquinone/menaquinone biosynthesis C-methylase UbiE
MTICWGRIFKESFPMGRLDEGWKSEELVRTFIDGIRGGIPLGKQQIEVMLMLVAATMDKPESLLDLGCGDGVLSEAVLTRYPDAKATLVDFSEPMLLEARRRFGSKADPPRFVRVDFSDKAWTESVKASAPFDLVISGYAIHHQTDELKRRLYAEVFGLLKPGGLFINIDHVKARSGWALTLFDEYLSESLKKFNADKGTPELFDKVAELTDDRKKREADVIATVEAQCEWLREIGFTDVDCFFKIFELALFAGLHP